MHTNSRCHHPSNLLVSGEGIHQAFCRSCGETIPCPHREIRGPLVQGQAGAFCTVCEAERPCPHPEWKRIRDNRLGGGTNRTKLEPGMCGLCGVNLTA